MRAPFEKHDVIVWVGLHAAIQNIKMASRAHEAEAEGSTSKPGIVKLSDFNLGSPSIFNRWVRHLRAC